MKIQLNEQDRQELEQALATNVFNTDGQIMSSRNLKVEYDPTTGEPETAEARQSSSAVKDWLADKENPIKGKSLENASAGELAEQLAEKLTGKNI